MEDDDSSLLGLAMEAFHGGSQWRLLVMVEVGDRCSQLRLLVMVEVGERGSQWRLAMEDCDGGNDMG